MSITKRQADFLLFIVAILWGSSYVFAKLTVEAGMHSGLISACRDTMCIFAGRVILMLESFLGNAMADIIGYDSLTPQLVVSGVILLAANTMLKIGLRSLVVLKESYSKSQVAKLWHKFPIIGQTFTIRYPKKPKCSVSPDAWALFVLVGPTARQTAKQERLLPCSWLIFN